MIKKILLALGIIVILGIVGVVYYIASGGAQKSAEDALREENPLFHTVPEGGTCRPGEGDCESGLTCGENNICVKY